MRSIKIGSAQSVLVFPLTCYTLHATTMQPTGHILAKPSRSNEHDKCLLMNGPTDFNRRRINHGNIHMLYDVHYTRRLLHYIATFRASWQIILNSQPNYYTVPQTILLHSLIFPKNQVRIRLVIAG